VAIEIQNAKVMPELVYNRVFMQRLNIQQKSVSDDGASPGYELQIEYRTYAVDGEGVRHYSPKVNVILLSDYFSVAMERATKGDTELVEAMQSIEKALALIIQDQSDLGNTTVI
jgi:hypothetical protein